MVRGVEEGRTCRMVEDWVCLAASDAWLVLVVLRLRATISSWRRGIKPGSIAVPPDTRMDDAIVFAQIAGDLEL